MDFAEGVFKGLSLVNDYYQKKAEREYRMAKDERDMAHTVERDKRSDFKEDRAFGEQVRQYDETAQRQQSQFDTHQKFREKELAQRQYEFGKNYGLNVRKQDWEETKDKAELMLRLGENKTNVVSESESESLSGNGGTGASSRTNSPTGKADQEAIKIAKEIIDNPNISWGDKLNRIKNLQEKTQYTETFNALEALKNTIVDMPTQEETVSLNVFSKQGIPNLMNKMNDFISKGMSIDEALAKIVESINDNDDYRKGVNVYFKPILNNQFNQGMLAKDQNGNQFKITSYDKDSVYYKYNADDGKMYAYVNVLDDEGKKYYNVKTNIGVPLDVVGRDFSNYNLANQVHDERLTQNEYLKDLFDKGDIKSKNKLVQDALSGKDNGSLFNLYESDTGDILSGTPSDKVRTISSWLDEKISKAKGFKFLDVTTDNEREPSLNLSSAQASEKAVDKTVSDIANKNGEVTTSLSDNILKPLNDKGVYKSKNNILFSVDPQDPTNQNKAIILPQTTQNATGILDKRTKDYVDFATRKTIELNAYAQTLRDKGIDPSKDLGFIDLATSVNNDILNKREALINTTERTQMKLAVESKALRDLKQGAISDDTAKIIMNIPSVSNSRNLGIYTVKDIYNILDDKKGSDYYNIEKGVEEYAEANGLDKEYVMRQLNSYYKDRNRSYEQSGGDGGNSLRAIQNMTAQQISDTFGIDPSLSESFKQDIKNGVPLDDYDLNKNNSNVVSLLSDIDNTKDKDVYGFKDNNIISNELFASKYYVTGDKLPELPKSNKGGLTDVEQQNQGGNSGSGRNYRQHSSKTSNVVVTPKYSKETQEAVLGLLNSK